MKTSEVADDLRVYPARHRLDNLADKFAACSEDFMSEGREDEPDQTRNPRQLSVKVLRAMARKLAVDMDDLLAGDDDTAGSSQ